MADLKRAFEADDGIKVSGVVIPDTIVNQVRSSKPTYTGDLVTAIEFFNSLTQTDENRIAKSDFTYLNDQIVSQVNTYYEPDGTTVHAVENLSYTYSGDNLTKIEVS